MMHSPACISNVLEDELYLLIPHCRAAIHPTITIFNFVQNKADISVAYSVKNILPILCALKHQQTDTAVYFNTRIE